LRKIHPNQIIFKTVAAFKSKIWRTTHPFSSIYRIEGTRNLNRNTAYCSIESEPNFQALKYQFQRNFQNELKNGISKTYYKFGDGDYYFLKGIAAGSAAPGKRALSRKLTSRELELFRKNSLGADEYFCEIPPENREMFRDALPGVSISYPGEIVYGLIANKWLLNLPNTRVGLIGSKPKLELIETLLEYEEYQEYLGIEKFHNYVKIPQKFACDDLELRLSEIKNQIDKSRCDLYFMGVGHLKSGIISELKKYSPSIFLDIGSGIDAIAGIIDRERPYFGGWINYRTKEFDYNRLDYLQYERSRVKKLR
jgi:hypothetical protein